MQQKKQRNKRIITVVLLLIVIASCGLISRFAFQLALIDGASMKPAYKSLQFVLIDKTKRDFNTGDVVSVRLDSGRMIVKRIAAAPGDRLIISDGIISVNGEQSPVYRDSEIEFAGSAKNEIILGEGEYFVLGDNLKESRDSRYEEVGIISEKQITGRIVPQKNFE